MPNSPLFCVVVFSFPQVLRNRCPSPLTIKLHDYKRFCLFLFDATFIINSLFTRNFMG